MSEQNNGKKTSGKEIAALIMLFAAAALLIVFELMEINFTGDRLKDGMLKELLTRLPTGVIFTVITILLGNGKFFIPSFKDFRKRLLWCLPCILVVLANFPWYAVISGGARVERTDLVWLFALKCVSVGFMEEILFRGLLQPTVDDFFRQKKYRNILTVAVTSAIFGLFHLFNLFAGAGVGETFLQAGYSFLIGAMLSAVLIKTQNIWLCVILHAVFNFGGNLIPELGAGVFQDACFWVLTAVAGVICFIHVLYFLLKKENPYCHSERTK